MTKLEPKNGIRKKSANVKKAHKAKKQGKDDNRQPKVQPQKTLEVEEEKEYPNETSLHMRSTMAYSTADPGEGEPVIDGIRSDLKIRIVL